MEFVQNVQFGKFSIGEGVHMASFFSSMQPIQKMTFSPEKAVQTTDDEKLASVPFASVLQNAVNEYSTLQETSNQEIQQLALGNADNLAQITIDSLKAKAALQTTVQLTSRIVGAYKEIMQMQV